MGHDHGHDAVFPIIWFIMDDEGNRIGETIQMTLEHAQVDAINRLGSRVKAVVDSGKRKPPSKCCSKCGDKPCS